MRNNLRLTRKPRRTFTSIRGNRILANAAIFTRPGRAVIDINLASIPSESDGTRALEPIFHIAADASIQTGISLALVNIHLALCACKSRHAHAAESAGVVET